MDGEGEHTVVCLCLPGKLCQVPTPPHYHTAPVPQPPQQGLSAALNMCECDGHLAMVCLCLPKEGRVVCCEGRLAAKGGEE